MSRPGYYDRLYRRNRDPVLNEAQFSEQKPKPRRRPPPLSYEERISTKPKPQMPAVPVKRQRYG